MEEEVTQETADMIILSAEELIANLQYAIQQHNDGKSTSDTIAFVLAEDAYNFFSICEQAGVEI